MHTYKYACLPCLLQDCLRTHCQLPKPCPAQPHHHHGVKAVAVTALTCEHSAAHSQIPESTRPHSEHLQCPAQPHHKLSISTTSCPTTLLTLLPGMMLLFVTFMSSPAHRDTSHVGTPWVVAAHTPPTLLRSVAWIAPRTLAPTLKRCCTMRVPCLLLYDECCNVHSSCVLFRPLCRR